MSLLFFWSLLMIMDQPMRTNLAHLGKYHGRRSPLLRGRENLNCTALYSICGGNLSSIKSESVVAKKRYIPQFRAYVKPEGHKDSILGPLKKASVSPKLRLQ